MSPESIDSFFAMGGHGLYVWLCYVVGLLVFISALVLPILRKKAILKELQQLRRRSHALSKQVSGIE